MTCNTVNNENELKQAFNTVSNDKSGHEWCIFEYDGNSNIIRLGSTGSDGIDGLVEALNTAKVQYGFASIKCESQIKIVLIHWGDGVPAIRRSQTAPHLSEIQRFVRSVSITINARNEEDIDLSAIYRQLSKTDAVVPAAQSTLSNNLPIVPQKQSVASIGNSKSIPGAKNTRAWIPPTPKTLAAMSNVPVQQQPAKVDLDERTKFWQEMRVEEEQRRKEDAERQEQQRQQFALERRNLETQLHEALLAKNNAIAVQKLQNGNGMAKKSGANDAIAGRRLIFEQKLAEIAATIPKPLTKPKNFKFQVGVSKSNTAVMPEAQNISTAQSDEGIETPALSVKSVLQQFKQSSNGQLSQQTSKQNEEKNDFDQLAEQKSITVSKQPNGTNVPTLFVHSMSKNDTFDPLESIDIIKQTNAISIGSESNSISVKALWDYQAEDDGELNFDPGDIITNVEMIHEGWWRGRAKNGVVGLFPSNFVEILQ